MDPEAPDRPVLGAGKRTTMRFGIGRKWPHSALNNTQPNSAILSSKENLRLTIVLGCNFCDPGARSLRSITYRPSARKSETVEFDFVPRRPQGDKVYLDILQLSIINDKTGKEYDRLLLTVEVKGVEQSPASAEEGTPVFRTSRSADAADVPEEVDLLLYAMRAPNDTVTLEFEPVSGVLKRRFGKLPFDKHGQRLILRSGIADKALIDAMSNSANGAISALSMQGTFLKRLSVTGIDAAVSKKSQESLNLTDEESHNVTAAIAEIGKMLYSTLFYGSADPKVGQLVKILEEAADGAPIGRPLRLKIVTDTLTLPWQYLHIVGPEADAHKFWGMKFSMSVHRANNGSPGTGPPLDVRTRNKILFARYGSDSDSTYRLADLEVAQLRKMPLETEELTIVDSGKDLFEALAVDRKNITGIMTFLHASAGNSGMPPSLQFGEGDLVTSDRLIALSGHLTPDEQGNNYFAAGPLVILNACETGPARALAHVKLQDAMFRLGAQGVLVTEVSVWVNLGHEMTTRLLERLQRGESISDAITAVRLELLAEKKNPLGLLYAYYGDPQATLRRRTH
jgi:hypothetical protein